MPRLFSIADEKRRDAAVEMAGPSRRKETRQVAKADGKALQVERLIKSTDRTSYAALKAQCADDSALAQALIAGDPELDLDNCGRRLEHAARVYMNQLGEILYATRTLQVKTNAAGEELERTDFVDVEATVGEAMPPLYWSGKLLPKIEVVQKFAMVRKMQIRHINGLTFDFLFDMAKTLHDAGKMMIVGAGNKGQLPIVFQTNGTPYRGFLEGRVHEGTYALVLHLSNLELRVPAAPIDNKASLDPKAPLDA